MLRDATKKFLLAHHSILPQIIAFFLIIILLTLAITSLKVKSFTIDEGNYLDSGEHLVRNFNWDHYVLRFHPPLTFYYHGLFSLFPLGNNKLFYARLMMMPILVALALMIFAKASRLYGKRAGLFALALFCFDPNILAHGRLITPDLTLTMFIFLFLILFYKFLIAEKKIGPKAVSTGIILGLALLTKYNGLMLFPLSLFFFGVYLIWQIVKNKKTNYRKIVGLLVIYFVAIFMVNLGYGFISSSSLPQELKTKTFQGLAKNRITNKVMKVFPGIYLTGVDYQLFESQREYFWQFFWGQRVSWGFWYFFPLSFLIKVPIPFLIFLCLTLFFALKKKLKIGAFEFYLLFASLFFFIYFSFFNKLIIGFRYILMIFPLLFVLTSPLANLKFSNKKVNNFYWFLLGSLITWYVLGTLKIHPHYLAYVNEFVGGPKNAYKYYADSNLDWGQNWTLLARFKEKNKENIIEDPKKPVVGKILISVNSFNLFNYDDYQWLRQLKKEPIDNIGYTWLIFEITQEDIEKLENL